MTQPLSVNASAWLFDFMIWWQEDFPNQEISIETYMQLLVPTYAQAAHKVWDKQWWGGKAKKEKLDSFVEIVEGRPIVDDAGVISYLSEQFDDNFRMAHSEAARIFAKEVVQKSMMN